MVSRFLKTRKPRRRGDESTAAVAFHNLVGSSVQNRRLSHLLLHLGAAWSRKEPFKGHACRDCLVKASLVGQASPRGTFPRAAERRRRLAPRIGAAETEDFSLRTPFAHLK